MAYVYDDNSGNYVWQDDPQPDQTQAPPAPGPQLGSYGVPINSNQPVGTQDLSYWQSRHDEGLPGAPGVDDMFDTTTGQLKPGWKRTGNGYEMDRPAPPGTPTTTLPPTDKIPTTIGGFGGGNFSFGPSGWNWPTFNAPRFSYGDFQAPAPFEFKTFNAPSLAEAEQEPGYAFARDQGIHALENNAAARGILRSGGTLKDFISFGNKFAEQNYGNSFNRSKDVFNTNEGNRFNAYQSNFGNALSTYGTNRDTAEHVFDRNYKGDWDMYSSQMDASKTEFGGALQKWLAQLNSLTQLSQPVG